MDPIKDFLEIIKPARAQVYQNLVLFPLLAPESGEPDYLTLEEALKAGGGGHHRGQRRRAGPGTEAGQPVGVQNSDPGRGGA